MEVLFYHLTQSPLETTLPELLERSLGRGWRAVVQAGSAGRVAALDAMLWTYRDDSFLPHGTAQMGHAEDQPVWLTDRPENPNNAHVLFLVDGARFDPATSGYDRVCLLFDGHDPEAVGAARQDWMAVKTSGAPGKYWSQEGGKWAEKAST